MVTKSIRCRLDCAVWCEYFKSGECTSPVKCEYQTEHISAKFLETIFFPTEEAWEKMQAENSRLTAENAELRARLERAEELPYRHLEMLKLLTCASICYAEIKDLITARMGKSKDIADLFLKCPTVQGTTLDFALYNLAKSNLDCNNIKGFEDVINATGTFKDYLAKAEARLNELLGGER